jgi:aryl-alcohol dehydrogenase-like predicted oxidoreductase
MNRAQHGSVDEKRPRLTVPPRGRKPEAKEPGAELAAVLGRCLRVRLGRLARVTLAWLIAQPGITASIASATKEKHLTDMVEAAKLKLDAESLQKLNEASARKDAAEAMAT